MQHKFVEFIPDEIQEGILYISIEYCTAVHKCVCGCENEVVTPFTPTDWELRFDGKTVTLLPSIGNWSFECKSHYHIIRNQIRFSSRWSRMKIDEGRKDDLENKKRFFKKRKH